MIVAFYIPPLSCTFDDRRRRPGSVRATYALLLPPRGLDAGRTIEHTLACTGRWHSDRVRSRGARSRRARGGKIYACSVDTFAGHAKVDVQICVVPIDRRRKDHIPHDSGALLRQFGLECRMRRSIISCIGAIITFPCPRQHRRPARFPPTRLEKQSTR
jgi:hypothetical protein